jgi:hypothetical protein
MIFVRFLTLLLYNQSKEFNYCVISKYVHVDKVRLLSNWNSGTMKPNVSLDER